MTSCLNIGYDPSVHDDDEYDEGIDEMEEIEDECDLSPLTEAAIAAHEVYLALTEGGFQEYDALRIIAYLISEQGMGE